ncbi:6-hydroxymethylpterin diphosphokinase MptE-like protein [Vibrio parahaemolyticus]|uniref:6-hydroxymethylpterin diphosphokinase MptE-like protein n=1 Tax=Vibrio parahaemolyticus TaxID=670 RepID=UPI0011218580|nr:6-hydroxymethylpterin diphosphokinase MptE-like protein [Vibrio parahaemolyticus]TOG48143.1 glycosyl transferase family 2 [Vibrio parahaemolyticus]
MKKILVFTDSRGQHKPAGSTHKIFGERLKYDVKDVEVDLVLCPMKWTTTLDFYEYCNSHDTSQYDWIVLYTGIVEWSPRPISSAFDDLYDNSNESNLDTVDFNTRDYSRKIVNRKKTTFDLFFGEKNIIQYLKTPMETEFLGEKTVNMYSLDMARDKVIPWLKKMDNLIFINSNNILSNWNGDHKKGRPDNINITHDYSELFVKESVSRHIVDISVWSEDEIRSYTCDNMHLTHKGSDYIFEQLCNIMSLKKKTKLELTTEMFESKMERNLNNLLKFRNIERFVGVKKSNFLASATKNEPLATLIVGFRIPQDDPSRLDNLLFLIKWLEYHYEDMFDILLVEQDSKQKFFLTDYDISSSIRYEFIYNPRDYNRGWGYNVAVKHFCNDAKVVVLMDTDVLPGDNFVSEIRDCYNGRYKVISPYQNVYYTDETEANEIKSSMRLSKLEDVKKIKNPVTITGGIVIFDKNTYLGIKGFEQYIGYGCEDRALDVSVLNLCDESKVHIAQRAYVHLYHPTDVSARGNFDDIYAHLTSNYNCKWHASLTPKDFIHSRCEHSDRETTLELMLKRSSSFADLDLYKKGNELSANGQVVREAKDVDESILFPPDFKGLDDYRDRELYEAPTADVSDLSKFYNAFKGERCFIIGNGPSLNKHDLSLIENEYTFGVNSFYYKTRETGFRPYFYVVEDSSVMKENIKEIREYHAPFKFFPTVYKRLHAKDPNTFFFEMNRGFYEKSSPNYAVPRFSTDATKELFCGQSVTYINLQLAFFMGFTEVYLIGMDFSYVIPESHARTGDVLLSDTDDENHFHKDYFGKGKTWKDPKLERVGNNYRMAKVVYESVGRKIYNATVGGSLEIFDRIDYDGLFNTEETADSVSKVALHRNTFAEANKLYQAKRYSDALVQYLRLVEVNPEFHIYKEAAMSCYLKAMESKQPVQQELKDKVLKFL